MSGLINELLKPFLSIGIMPKSELTQNELVITLTEEEVKKAILKGVDERFRKYFDVKVENGVIKIIVRLR